MVRWFLALVLTLAAAAPAAAEGGWYWLAQPNGLYIRSNGYENDGWFYNKVCAGGYYSCGVWYPGTCSYAKVVAIEGAPGAAASYDSSYSRTTKTVTYSNTWKEHVVDALHQKNEGQLFLRALAESGLQATPGTYGSSGYGYGGAYQTAGQTALYQGFAATGNPVWGVAANNSGYQPVDANGQLYHLQRSTDRLGEIFGRANAFVASNVNTAVAGNVEEAKIRAATAGNVAAILASQTSAQQTSYQTQPTAPPQQQPAGDGPPPLPPQPAGGAAAPQPTVGQLIYQVRCSGCHGANQPKANLNLASLRGWPVENKMQLVAEVNRRVHLNTDKRMPPPDKGEGLTDGELKALDDYLLAE